MSLKLITPATGLLLTLAQTKEHLRVDADDEDEGITMMIKAATNAAEHATGRTLQTKTYRAGFDAFAPVLQLMQVPVQSVTSVKYVDADGALQTISATDYVVTADDSSAFITPKFGAHWPEAQAVFDAVQVTYVSGYAGDDAVPDVIKAWCKLQVGAMYSNREAEISERGSAVSLGFADTLLDGYRVYQ